MMLQPILADFGSGASDPECFDPTVTIACGPQVGTIYGKGHHVGQKKQRREEQDRDEDKTTFGRGEAPERSRHWSYLGGLGRKIVERSSAVSGAVTVGFGWGLLVRTVTTTEVTASRCVAVSAAPRSFPSRSKYRTRKPSGGTSLIKGCGGPPPVPR